MRIGLYLDLRNPPAWRREWARHYAWTLELIEEAERLGAGSAWVTEHHLFEDGYLPQPLTFAAAIAARTSRIRIGTSVLLAPLRPAIQILEEATVVDIISGGRLELGLGAGYRVPEFSAFGADFDARYRVTGERIAEIRSLLASGRITPPPIQDPLPLWLGAMGPAAARRAGTLGTGLLSARRPLVEEYARAWNEAGHDPAGARAGGLVNIVLADDPDEAFARIAPHVAYQWDTYNRYGVEGTDKQPPKPIDPHRWREPTAPGELPRFAVMTPDDAAATLRGRYDDLPVTDLYLWASIAGMPDELAERHVELLCTTLIPVLS